jgi:hypothetical protein
LKTFVGVGHDDLLLATGRLWRSDHAKGWSHLAWSTRQLAELAGTTVKAVRHYHRVALLDEPERTTNNDKQYDVSHLVRLLRIIRLTDLDVQLARIRESP